MLRPMSTTTNPQTTTATQAPVNWFEIGTADVDRAKQFYGTIFGWTFATDPDVGDLDYTIISTDGDEGPKGGIFGIGHVIPPYAVFCAMVADVDEACAHAVAHGGSVLVEPSSTPNGLRFAHLRDPDGNQLGVYSPPKGT